MYDITNPPGTPGGPSSVGSTMQSMVATNPNLGVMRGYANNVTKASVVASRWGASFDMASIPQWTQESFIEDVLFAVRHRPEKSGEGMFCGDASGSAR